ncbi:MAG: hypothetical protein IPM54_30505 [Polyangiaceae bacterium]|nr:hypothetical protein [Polyangiaceae bacterium]
MAKLHPPALALLVCQALACQPCVSIDKPSDNPRPKGSIIVKRPPPSDWITDWTLLIYAANDDLDPNLVAAFDDDALEWQHGLGGSALFRIMVQRDYAPFQLNSEDEPRPSERYSVYREERHHPEHPPTVDAPEAMLLGETDTTSSTTLRDFLVYGIRTFPARHYWVTVTGHGDGFAGLATDASAGPGRRLSIDGLSAALAEASAVIAAEIRTKPGYDGPDTSNRIDVVAFDACRLGTIEVAASVAQSADFMIASQESMPYAGHPYSALRFIAQDHPDASPRALVEAVVTDYVRAYVEGVSTAGRAYVGTSVTSVGLDLRRLSPLESALDELASAVERSHPRGFTCTEVQALLTEACHQAHVALPERQSVEMAGDAGLPRTQTTVAAAASVDLIALLEHMAQGPACLGAAPQNAASLGDIAKAARKALDIIGRPPLWAPHNPSGVRFQYGGQYRKIVDFGPSSPFVVEAQRVDPDSNVRLGGLGVLWGNPFDLLLRENGKSLMDTYRTLPFDVRTGWTRMMRACIEEAEACRTYEPSPDEPISEGPCANF